MKFVKRNRNLCVLILILLIIFVFSTKKSLAEDISTEKENKIDILEILKKNTENVVSEEIIKEEIDLEYTTIYKDNNSLPKGKMQVVQEGRDGKQQIVIKKTYEGTELTNEKEVSDKVIKSSVNKIVEVGTSNYTSNYKVKIGETLYVTSSFLGIKISSEVEAEKIITVNKNEKLKLLEIRNEWYKVSYNNYVGWVEANCVTYDEPEIENKVNTDKKKKEELISKLDKNMNLNTPSGLTLEQFKKVLSDENKDKKGIFGDNAEYFYYIESQYNINGVFVAAVGIHESSWGTSKIAIDKMNLFGYGAYDIAPYSNAKSFSSYSEGIDLIARVFVKYYLNPEGTKIYDGQTATGKYYKGSTLEAVNTYYATDKKWADSVYSWMEYLYKKL